MENKTNPCINCAYSNAWGDSTRTETCKGRKERISWDRLSEISTKCMHELLANDSAYAKEFFREELDLTEEECDYFEITTETEPYEFGCPDCPYYYPDDFENGEPERCHYQGEDGYAPCSYEEEPEVDWSEYE